MLKRLHADGWEIVVTKGSYRQLKHTTKPCLVSFRGRCKRGWRQAEQLVRSIGEREPAKRNR